MPSPVPKVVPSIGYSEISDITATLLTEVWHYVSVEPDFQPVTNIFSIANTDDGAHLDIAAEGRLLSTHL